MPTNKKQRPSAKSAQPARPKGKPAAAKGAKAAPRKAPLKIVRFAPPAAKKGAPAARSAAPAKAPATKSAAKARAAAQGKSAPATKAAPAKKSAQAKPAASAKSAPAKLLPVPAKGSAAPSARLAPASAPATPTPTSAPNSSSYLVVLSAHERRGRRFVQLKSPSVLAWFQRGCRLARESKGWAGDLGGEVRGLDVLFDAVENRRLPVPNSEAELQALLTKYLRAERDLEVEPHFVHVETDDDETEIEYFFFDDAFLESGEALDRLPSPKRRARPVDDDESGEEESFEADEDDDPYTQLIEKIADA